MRLRDKSVVEKKRMAKDRRKWEKLIRVNEWMRIEEKEEHPRNENSWNNLNSFCITRIRLKITYVNIRTFDLNCSYTGTIPAITIPIRSSLSYSNANACGYAIIFPVSAIHSEHIADDVLSPPKCASIILFLPLHKKEQVRENAY